LMPVPSERLLRSKEVSEYRPRGYITVDVNESSEAVLIDGVVYLLETDLSEVTLGYYYRRKRVQEKYDEVYGPCSRPARRIFKRLSNNERVLKGDKVEAGRPNCQGGSSKKAGCHSS